MENSTEPAYPNDTFYGLTKREFFAAKAMQGLLSTCDGNEVAQNLPTVEYFAGLAVKAADELLKALETK